jgi:hypothetical protein
MPRRARLKNIAAGLCGSSASRNNDLDGYWAIGKLRLLAEQYGRTTVSLDVLTSSMQPSSPEFGPVLVRYFRLLAKLADLSRIELEEITAACVTVDFAPLPRPKASYYMLEWGDQFILTVTINADGRAAGIMRHSGYCRPHDPARENRSIRRAAC